MMQRPTVLPARGGVGTNALQNTPFFCTVREGVPQENTAVSRKYMQSVTEIMQIDEADSIVWCKGVRLICIRLVETNLTPLR